MSGRNKTIPSTEAFLFFCSHLIFRSTGHLYSDLPTVDIDEDERDTKTNDIDDNDNEIRPVKM